ncbi:MAG: VPLPA-CTERM sorting domain-containing protein [Desulfuromonadales bacterium]|nr:VPLPA-CTERM sorting domain-containing protein [Desulfuromonadales bacterium]
MKKMVLAACLAVTLVAAGSANAALVSFNGGLTGSSYDPYPDPFLPLEKDGSIALTKFNLSQGTLNSVTLDLSSVFDYVTKFENKSPNSGSTITKSLDQQLTIGGNLLDTGKVNYTRNWTVQKFDNVIDYAGTSGFTVSESSGSTSVHLTLTGAAMASYIGTGNLLLDVYSHASFTGGFTGGNGDFRNTQNFVTSATVTYDYTPTPIPAAAWLLGSGLMGLAGIRRKKD